MRTNAPRDGPRGSTCYAERRARLDAQCRFRRRVRRDATLFSTPLATKSLDALRRRIDARGSIFNFSACIKTFSFLRSWQSLPKEHVKIFGVPRSPGHPG